MDPRNVEKKDGKAFRTHRVEVEDGYVVDQDYDLVLLEDEERGKTGLLPVFALKARESSLPSFQGRWDEKRPRDQKPGNPGALDVDMIDADGKRTKEGFEEHHTPQLPGNGRRFLVEIRVPAGGRLIFSGVVSFGLGFDLALGESFRATAGFSCDNELWRDGKVIPNDGVRPA